jgi:AraC family transcriptional regulator
MDAQTDDHSITPPSLAGYLAAHFGEEDEVVLQTSPGAKAGLELYRKRYAQPVFGQIAAPSPSGGFLIALALEPYQLRLGRRPMRHFALDSVMIHDLTQPFEAYIGSSFDILFLYISSAALDAVAEETGAAPVERLHGAAGMPDPVLAGLGRALLPALYAPIKGKALFVDCLAFALNLHIAQHYGALVLPGLTSKRGLTPLQENRAKEYLAAHLAADVSIAEVAAACGLSRSYFIKSFKESTGKTPHRWLLEHRLSRARSLLAKSSDAIAEIAISCGFADQSHLTRMFTREIGTPPSVWRRDYRA